MTDKQFRDWRFVVMALCVLAFGLFVALSSGCAATEHGAEVRTTMIPPGVNVRVNGVPPRVNPAAGDSIHALLQLYKPTAGAGRIANALFCDNVEAIGYSTAHATWQRYCVLPEPTTLPPPAINSVSGDGGEGSPSCPEPEPCPCPAGMACVPQDDYHDMAGELRDLRNDVSPGEVARLQNLLNQCEAAGANCPEADAAFKDAVCGTDLPEHVNNGKKHIRKVFNGNADIEKLGEQIVGIMRTIEDGCAP